jgi:transposase
MQFIEGKDRTQIVLYSDTLDQVVERDNEVRVIDAFVESINIADFDFKIKTSREGAPAYHPEDLLKLFVYGYLNRIRSSRQLEKECGRNIEVMWLLKQLVPDHNTIANFRKDNAAAIKKVFRHTVNIARHFDLIGGKLIAGDSTKLRAQNSRKNNFNPEKLKQHLEYIEKKLDEYNKELEEADEDKTDALGQEIKKQTERKVKYEGMQQQLKESGQTQISTADPESRLLTSAHQVKEVAYNVQSTVDAAHCLLIDFEVTNENDKKAMGTMVERAGQILQTNDFTALYDKGYYTGSQLQTAQATGATVIAGVPAASATAPDPRYNMEHFTYDASTDTYTCPQGEALTTTGAYYRRNPANPEYTAKQYRTKACTLCAVKVLCTKSSKGRVIERTIYAPCFEQNARNMAAQPEIYKQRKCIVEHPFGTLKRQWGFSYILTKKGKKRASADVGLMFIAYNLRRIINIIGKNVLKQYLGALALLFSWILTAAKRFALKMRDKIFTADFATCFPRPLSYRFKIAYT